MEKTGTEFWSKWHRANELEKVTLIKTLTLPGKIDDDTLYKHQCAVLLNSYLCDLADYLESLG